MFGSILSRLTGGGGADIDNAGVEAAIREGSHAIVDVREPHEFASGHIPGSVNMPLSRFDANKLPKGKPVILTCASGGRSGHACMQARQAGRGDVANHRGGVGGWARAGGKLAR
jgi:rhodanese-related sulfurtransferase